MKRLGLLILTILILSDLRSYAEKSVEGHKIDFSLDIYSRHLWRGFVNGNSVSVQPALEYSYSGFSTGAWAAASIDGSYYEFDLYTSYKAGSFKVTLYDYFCPVKPLSDNEFFEIEQGKTRHTFDLNIEYSQPEKHPFALLAATMIYGDDLNPDNGENHFSTYIEPSYNTTFYTVDMQVFAGFTPFKSYYAPSASFVNTGVAFARNFSITNNFSIEANMKLAYNPDSKKGWISLGLSL
jgi:hypothetical protein